MTARYGEAVCVAGITRDQPGDPPRWVRLYPVPFRDMPIEQRFKKWDEIEVDVAASTDDDRPETVVPVIETIDVTGHLDTAHGWEARRRYLADLPQFSMCQVQRDQRSEKTSLAMVRVKELIDVTVERREEAELKKARERIEAHRSLLDPDLRALEPIPYAFRYKWRCASTICSNHEQTIIDWELGALFRHQRYSHGEERAVESVREKYLSIADERHDFALFVGNQERHRASFLVIGVFYPLLLR